MGEFEKQVPFEADDLEKLNMEGGAPVGCSILLSLIFILPILFMLMWDFSLLQVLLILLTLGLGSLSVFLYFRHALDEKRKAGMDIQGGVKRVFTSPMESQKMTSRAKKRRTGSFRGTETGELDMSYFITVKGKEYEVSLETYMAIRPGELVEIHEGIHSGVTLRVLKSEQVVG